MHASRGISCGLLSGLLLAGSVANAQSGNLRARVLDSTRTPVANAEVSIPKLKRVDRTDSAGRITFSDLAPGRLEVAVRRINFFPEHFFVEVRSGETTALEIELSGQASTLSAVDVVA